MIRYDLKKREGGWYVMQPQPAGRYVTYLAVAELQRQLAEVTEDKKTMHAGLTKAYTQIGDLQRQVAEVTRERDTLKAMVDLHDALNDRRRAQANETPFKRRTYGNGG